MVSDTSIAHGHLSKLGTFQFNINSIYMKTMDT